MTDYLRAFLVGGLLCAFAQILIDRARGLCSFYAEDHGLLIGFETA